MFKPQGRSKSIPSLASCWVCLKEVLCLFYFLQLQQTFQKEHIPHSLLRDSASCSGSRVQVWAQLWAPAGSLAIISDSCLALGSWNRFSWSDGQAQVREVLVCCNTCGQLPAFRKKCYTLAILTCLFKSQKWFMLWKLSNSFFQWKMEFLIFDGFYKLLLWIRVLLITPNYLLVTVKIRHRNKLACS